MSALPGRLDGLAGRHGSARRNVVVTAAGLVFAGQPITINARTAPVVTAATMIYDPKSITVVQAGAAFALRQHRLWIGIGVRL